MTELGIIQIDRYCRRTGLTKSQVGHEAGVGETVRLWSEGRREPTAATKEKIRAWMDAHPDGIPDRGRGRRREGL